MMREVERLQGEVVRLNKIVRALMDRAERDEGGEGSAYGLFHTTLMLEEEVRRRTAELASALQANERITSALRESEEKFRALVDQTLVGITLHDHERFVYVNPGFATMSGYGVDELAGMSAFDITPPDGREAVGQLIREAFAGRPAPGSMVVQVLRKDGMVVNAEISGGAPILVGGKPVLMAVWMDVSERMRAEQEVLKLNRRLREQAIRDALTGLFNRRYLEEVLACQLTSAQGRGFPVSVIMGDIDHFKAVNDTFGHQAGDEVLRRFGQVLARHARADDMACRYGGEEFLLVLPGLPPEQAMHRAEQLRLAISELAVPYELAVLQVTASFGVASYPLHALGGDGLIAAADAALYQAKATGRNRVQCAPPLVQG